MDRKSKSRRKRLNAILSVIVSAHMVLSMIPAEALAGMVDQAGVTEQARAGTGDADAVLEASGETSSAGTSATAGSTGTSGKDAADTVELKAVLGDAGLSLRAPVGTLPKGASLRVGEVDGDIAREVARAVDEARTSGADEDQEVKGDNKDGAASYAFDVRLEDAEGRELDLVAETPETELSFSVREATDAGLAARVFRVVEERVDPGLEESDGAESVYFLETQGEAQESDGSDDARDERGCGNVTAGGDDCACAGSNGHDDVHASLGCDHGRRCALRHRGRDHVARAPGLRWHGLACLWRPARPEKEEKRVA